MHTTHRLLIALTPLLVALFVIISNASILSHRLTGLATDIPCVKYGKYEFATDERGIPLPDSCPRHGRSGHFECVGTNAFDRGGTCNWIDRNPCSAGTCPLSAGLYCNPDTGYCDYFRCPEVFQCRPGFYCSNGKCEQNSSSSVSSSSSSSSSSSLTPYGGRCGSNADCLSKWCERGYCGCNLDQDCPEGSYCGPNNSGGYGCIAKLEKGARCNLDSACQSGNCELAESRLFSQCGLSQEEQAAWEQEQAAAQCQQAETEWANVQTTYDAAQETWDDAQAARDDAQEAWDAAKDAYAEVKNSYKEAAAACRDDYAQSRGDCADEETTAERKTCLASAKSERTACVAEAKAEVTAAKTEYVAAQRARTAAKNAYASAKAAWRTAGKTFKSAQKTHDKAVKACD